MEDIASRILSDPNVLERIAEKVYDRIKNEVIIKRLEMMEETLRVLVEETKNTNKRIEMQQEEIKKIWQSIEENTNAIRELREENKKIWQSIEDHSKRIEENTNAIRELREENKKIWQSIEDHSKRIEENTNAIRELREENKKIWQSIEENTNAIRELREENKKIWQSIEENTNAIRELREENKKIWQSIEENTNAIRELQEQFNKMYERFERESKETRKEIERLRISFDSFTSRAGRYIERTIMEVFKEALVIHGIDPSKIEHGKIIDEVGIIKKGREYEVDFYETDGIIYIFEVKNFADEGALEQLEVRRKLFQAKYNKPVKAYLICNSIEKHVKEMMEKEGIIVITGHIIED